MPDSLASFFDLSLAVQISLGAGYSAYVTAYAGLLRQHGAFESAAKVLIFSAIALAITSLLEGNNALLLVAGSLSATLILAIVWRSVGLKVWRYILQTLNIHREDGLSSGWEAIVQTSREVSQATVTMNDGTELHLSDRAPYLESEWQGLYLGGDGSVTLAVDQVFHPNGKEELRDNTFDKVWGTRMTFIPVDQMKRVELRMK